jgi:hypothetical protein
MLKDSIYRETLSRKDRRINLGYDYKDNIMKNTLSSQMFGINETLDRFIKSANDCVYEWIEAVKTIKAYANPAVDKNDNKIN